MKQVSLFIALFFVSFSSFAQKKALMNIEGTHEWLSAGGAIYHEEAVKYVSIVTQIKEEGCYGYTVKAIDADGDALMTIIFKGSADLYPVEDAVDILAENKAFRVILKGRNPKRVTLD
jgi:hypothetical protein